MTVLTEPEPTICREHLGGIRRRKPFLGTYVEIGVDQASVGAQQAIGKAFAGIETIHALMSFHDPQSELSRLNGAGGKPVTLHAITRRVLTLARGMTRASGQLFNCTVGGSLVRSGVLPDHTGRPALDHGDANDIELVGQTARLRRPVLVTLDGIAKGYAVDLAVRILKQHGLAGGWVNAGGDMRVFGKTSLAVHRREADGHIVPMGRLRNAAMASSMAQLGWDPDVPGMMVAGRADVSPRTGVWSVVSSWAWRADALTKVAGLAPDDVREDLIARLGGWLVAPMQGS